MKPYNSLILLGLASTGVVALLALKLEDRSLVVAISVGIVGISLALTFLLTKRWLDTEHKDELNEVKEEYEGKIRRLKTKHDITTLEKTIRDGTQALIKNAVEYFKLENIKNEQGTSAAIQNLQLDKYGQIIELLADFSMILPDFKENRRIVQREIDHKIEIYQIDEKPFALFLQRILEKYEITLNKRLKEKQPQLESESTKLCPQCDGLVLSRARVCKHCGYQFKASPKSPIHSSLAFERIEKGRQMFASGQYQEALNLFSSAVDLKPNFAVAYYNRAIVFNKLGNRKAAEQDLKEAAYLGHGRAKEILKLKGIHPTRSKG